MPKNRMNFDLDVLRSFVLGIELGSFARAAGRLGRSTSAVSAQLKKLEEQAGAALFIKAGRGLALTDAGQTMLAYARRLLDLNDEAVEAVSALMTEGWVRIGLQQDFGETLLPAILGQFARAQPHVRIEAQVGRNAELLERVSLGQLDLVLGWDDGGAMPHKEVIADLPMAWIAAREWPGHLASPLPLVLFDDACLFCAAATEALDRAGLAWVTAFSSHTLGGVWAGVGAGFGLTARTRIGLPATVQALDAGTAGLPALPSIRLALFRKDARLDGPAARLAAILASEAREIALACHAESST